MEPNEIFNVNKLEHQRLVSLIDGESFSNSLVLTDLLKFKNLFVHHEILLPGLRASSPHFHTLKEEMILILTGYPTAHIGNRIVQLKPGDFIGFTPDSKKTHFIKNDTMEEIRFLVICSNPEKDQTIYE